MVIRGVKVEVTPAIKNHIIEKIGKLDKYLKEPEKVNATVIIRVRNNEQMIEVTVVTQKFTLRAEESHSDLYAAVDLVLDKLESQIRKHKTRLKDKYKKEPNNLKDFLFDFDIKEEKENHNKIVKRKNINSKPMDEEEAILQMELIGHDFFIFNNVNEDCVSVIYKRKDGNYGIINTK
ncbi:MAG: ribosome-associated translation inhibitor RaiA [Bacilli bacterium]|nr:ribosome-associated translation inhibitor RaiA [Bacilli bacterium]MDD3895758.1 ribosome-associated translation inhibitor RaiA [Bacilli bacterium]MDD4407583.1 ribosome-associated translation inhibitor RaiA [Bacilli bacterium]